MFEPTFFFSLFLFTRDFVSNLSITSLALFQHKKEGSVCYPFLIFYKFYICGFLFLLSRTTLEKDEADPSKLSLSERIKMFNTKVSETNFLKRDGPKRRQTRFQTQPVTSEEVKSARCVSPDNKALGVLS